MPRATDIMPMTGFTRAYKKVVRELRKSGRPRVLTIDGKPSLVILDAAAFDRLVDLVDAEYIENAVEKALADRRPGISVDQLRDHIGSLKRKTARSRAAKRRAA